MREQWTALCTKVGEVTDRTLQKAEILGQCAALRRKIKKTQQKLEHAYSALGRLAYRQLKDYDTNLLSYPKEYAAAVKQIDAIKVSLRILRANLRAKEAAAHGKTPEEAEAAVYEVVAEATEAEVDPQTSPAQETAP